MIDLHVRVNGGTLAYVAKENETTTPAEVELMGKLVDAILKHMTDTGMTGQAVNVIPKP